MPENDYGQQLLESAVGPVCRGSCRATIPCQKNGFGHAYNLAQKIHCGGKLLPRWYIWHRPYPGTVGGPIQQCHMIGPIICGAIHKGTM